jgi:hypothetical protein
MLQLLIVPCKTSPLRTSVESGAEARQRSNAGAGAATFPAYRFSAGHQLMYRRRRIPPPLASAPVGQESLTLSPTLNTIDTRGPIWAPTSHVEARDELSSFRLSPSVAFGDLMATHIPEDLLALVHDSAKDDFKIFFRTGKITTKFSEILKVHRDSQIALEQVLKGRLRAIQRVGAAMAGKLERSESEPQFDPGEDALIVGQALLELAARDSDQRRQILDLCVSMLRDERDSREAVLEVLEELMHKLKVDTGTFQRQPVPAYR